MNGLEELMQGNSIRWTRRRTEDWEKVPPDLSPEIVMAEFDRQVCSFIHNNQKINCNLKTGFKIPQTCDLYHN